MEKVVYVRYIANDGEEFADEQVCRDYEAQCCPTFKHIQMFNHDFDPAFVEDAIYIVIERNCSKAELAKFNCYAKNVLTGNIPDFTPGIWAWEEAEHGWDSFYNLEARYNRLGRIIDTLQNRKESDSNEV